MYGPAWLGKKSRQVMSWAKEGQDRKACHLAAVPAGPAEGKAPGAAPSKRMLWDDGNVLCPSCRFGSRDHMWLLSP